MAENGVYYVVFSKTSIQEVGAQFEKKYNTIDAEVQSLIEVTSWKWQFFDFSIYSLPVFCNTFYNFEKALEVTLTPG